MEEIFITKIDIKKLRNVENVTIDLSDTKRKHLILTGKNGSGKTSFLGELEYIPDFGDFDVNLSFPTYHKKKPIKISYSVSEEKVFAAWETNSFIKVFFAAERKSEMVIPRRIEKLDILNQSQNTNDNLKQYFLQFLVNLVADGSFANEDNDQT